MATMFGFPNFVLSRRQPVGDGRFGYWYTDLEYVDDQETTVFMTPASTITQIGFILNF